MAYENAMYQGDAAVPQSSEMEMINSHLEQITVRLAQSTGELGSIADRMFGTRPEPVAPSHKGNPIAAGIVASMHDRIEVLNMEVSAIEDRVKRLAAL